MRYDPKKIEQKWEEVWRKKKIYEPELKKAKNPFYNLMMFPYPSAEGLHIGSVRTFTGVDIYGRMKRMQGHNVFEPMGLDGFGINSENYALKIGQHPAKLAKVTEKNFYRQLLEIGNSFAWDEHLETYDPEYYKWTQWIFVQLFKHGLAYRKKSAVNWCPSCLTVLADEQALSGECERCGTTVVKKDLEQWFFRITKYADRLLKNLEHIDWSERIKIAQKNWIGKSEGAEINFEIRSGEKPNFVLLHGYGGRPENNFFPWLRKELEARGYAVQVPLLPHSDKDKANEDDDMRVLREKVHFDKNTVLLGHSLGAIVALKALEKLGSPIRKLVLVGGFLEPKFRDHDRAFANTFSWQFDFKKIQDNAGEIIILHDRNDVAILLDQGEKLRVALGGELYEPVPVESHFCAKEEPSILPRLIDSLQAFTTRPDTLFGATYMVVAPEHQLMLKIKNQTLNIKEVDEYIQRAKAKKDEERIAEGKEKTGVELKGIKAINPANNEELPVWIADYVLGNVGTGAIMAVPAHDERDFEFAKKFNLPIKMVVCPHYPAKTCPVLDSAYTGGGHMVDSGKFNSMPFEKAKWEITKFVGGELKTQYRLRDWLISRQRYWGPPIPMIFCDACKKAGRGERGDMPGWFAVPEKNLPVKLPYVKDFRPRGTGESPLATVEKFYKVRCPRCKSWARRETDVSDTFLDSAWYYLRYPSVRDKKHPWDPAITKKWFPADMYIGGAEHAVLHLLYVRFLAFVFYDWKLTDFEEPFKKFRAHGLITKDGAKMSKSKGNVVNPDEYIRAFGADAIRMYLAFLAPLDQGGDFRDSGIKGMTRFLERVWKLANGKTGNGKLSKLVHQTIKKVTEDIESLQYNTAISALMILLNKFEEYPEAVAKEDLQIFLKLLAPFAPYITEELYQQLFGNKKFDSIHLEPWPVFDPELVQEDAFELVIQVNGRVRGKVTLSMGTSESDAKKASLEDEHIKQYVTKEPKKTIFIPNKLINFVV